MTDLLLPTVTTPPPVHPWDLDDVPELEFDPFLARQLREEPASRIRMPYGTGHAWLVTRYEDVRLVTSDPRFSRTAVAGKDVTRMLPHQIAANEAVGYADPPEHTRLRRTVAKAFTSRRMDSLRLRARRIADELADTVADHGPPLDLVAHLHKPLPLAVTSELMGVPEPDRPALARCAEPILSTAHSREDSERAQQETQAYFRTLLQSRAGEHGDDIASMLAAELAQENLSEGEAVALAVTIRISGLHAATNDSASMVYLLLTRPGLCDRLRSDPAVLPAAVEELLRYIPHRNGVGIGRIATEDVAVGEVVIPAGAIVYVSFLTANRDPAAFEVMLSTLLRRFPDLRLVVPAEEITWTPRPLIRGPRALPEAR